MHRLQRLDLAVRRLAVVAAVQMALMALARIIFALIHVDAATLAAHSDNLPLLLFNALRFDAQVAAYICLPMLPAVAAAALGGECAGHMAGQVMRVYGVVAATLVALLSAVDTCFYLNFESHFNIVLFDFMDENPRLLLRSIWNEYPVVTIASALGLLAIGLDLASWGWWKRMGESRPGRRTAAVRCTAAMVVLAVAVRGSLGTFPLRAEDIYVSADRTLCDCVPNAPFMLKKAWSERRKQFVLPTEADILAHNGFATEAEAVAAWLDISPDSAADISAEQCAFAVSGEAPAQGMHMVLIVTESWSNELLQMDDSAGGFDLLGSMRQHLREDIYMPHFQSYANGTIATVEALTVASPIENIYTSRYRFAEFPSAVARPYAEAGYDTRFVTGIELSWRNLQEVLPRQGFGTVTGKYEIMDATPREAQEGLCNRTWGVYDHRMLQYLLEQLQSAGRPTFAMALTSTSHTPFEFPAEFEMPELDPCFNSDRFCTDAVVTSDYLKGFQYETHALGRFMDSLKRSPLADSTIVFITGDHNIRTLLQYDKPSPMQHSVPLYVYVPRSVRTALSVDTTRYGSHTDLAATMAPLVLSHARHFAMGSNLFAEGDRPTVSINRRQIMHSKGISAAQAMRKAQAREAVCLLCFVRWMRSCTLPPATDADASDD